MSTYRVLETSRERQRGEWGGGVQWPEAAVEGICQPYRDMARTGFTYSNERGEPPHIHVQRERFLAKFWLRPVALARSKRFNSRELGAIKRIVEECEDEFLEAWNEHASG